ncbi:MAG: hypothetical protein DMG55_32385 [Acidobacteria bacterium]|nr:MAG: hypothetical protein DMG55_32385 [Acidobacteriota bacterium]
MADLQDDDKGFFQKDHNNSCPGLVKVDFYGDGKPTLALVLIGNGEGKDSSVLVVARARLKQTGISAPWPLAGQRYRLSGVCHRENTGTYGNKTIRRIRPVIAFTKYESWEILYAWTRNNKVAKVWLSDNHRARRVG